MKHTYSFESHLLLCTEYSKSLLNDRCCGMKHFLPSNPFSFAAMFLSSPFLSCSFVELIHFHCHFLHQYSVKDFIIQRKTVMIGYCKAIGSLLRTCYRYACFRSLRGPKEPMLVHLLHKREKFQQTF